MFVPNNLVEDILYIQPRGKGEKMDGLEADLRETFYLRLINGYSIAETASTLGKSEADVYSAQYRALYALAHLLDQY